MVTRPDIVVIGAGNVATHLAQGFHNAGCRVRQVFSRSLDRAAALAARIPGAEPVDRLDCLDTGAGLYVIAVADHAVSRIAAAMPPVSGVVAHTSGSVPIDALAPASSSYAVLYPLQTFSIDADVRLDEVPFFTEASSPGILERIDGFATLLSPRVYHADSARRRTLHVAGVLSCNFVNYLWDCTSRVLDCDGYDFSVVEPLVRATLEKAVSLGPHASQTGPAMRGDIEVMRRHIAMLDPSTAAIYRQLSNAILSDHNKNIRL